MRSILYLLLGCFVLLAIAPAASGATVLTFDELVTNGPGQGGPVAITDQYASMGVTFNSPFALDYSKGIAIPDFAHSGSVALEPCYAIEFCSSPVSISFTAGQARVKAWVGMSFAAQQPNTIRMRGYNAANVEVVSATVNLPANPSAPTPIRAPLEIGRIEADIRRVDISFVADQVFNNGLAVDDVEFDTIGPPPPCETFSLPQVTLKMPSGATTRCNRFLFEDEVYTGDPFSRRTVTITHPDGRKSAWTTVFSHYDKAGPIWISGSLSPGVNTVTDRVESCFGAREETRTVVYEPYPDGIRIRVLAYEATQGIQRIPPSVTLVAGKRTFVRVYVTLEGPLAELRNVKAHLSAYRPGPNIFEPGESIPPHIVSSWWKQTITNSTDLAALRQKVLGSFLFEVPASWTETGPVHFRLSSVTVEDGCDTSLEMVDFENLNGLGRPAYNTFVSVPAMDLRIVGAPYRFQRGNTLHSPTVKDVGYFVSWLRRAYPIPELKATYTKLEERIGSPEDKWGDWDAQDINNELLDMRAMDVASGAATPQTRYYGMVHIFSGYLMSGKVGSLRVATGPAGEAYGDFHDPSDSRLWDPDKNFGDWYGAHLLAHTYGVPDHAGCGGDDTEPYPFPFGQLDNNYVYGVYGYDPGSSDPWLSREIYRPDIWKDLMTACTHRWISDVTYHGILNRMKAEAETEGSRTESGHITDALLLSGKLNITQSSARLRSFWRFANVEGTDRPAASAYTIEMRDATEKNLAVYPFAPTVDTDPVPGLDVQAVFSEIVPWVAGTKRIVIVKDGLELGSKSVTPGVPTVQVLSPNGGENLDGETATVTWQASDPDGQPMTYSLQYSRDAGQTWQVVDPSITTMTLAVELNDLPGSAKALFRVIATDGVNTGMDASDATFTVKSKAPVVQILAPGVDDAFVSSDVIVFRGSATDHEDGVLDGASLTWTSDMQGPLGAGRSITATLQPGKHLVTLYATDSSDAFSTASIEVIVEASAPVARPGADRSTVVGVPVALDGRASTGVAPLAYAWEIVSRPEGSTATLTAADTALPSFTPDRLGDYEVQLTVTDGVGVKALARVTIIATSVIDSLRIAGGLAVATAADVSAWDVEVGGTSAGRIDLLDALSLVRRALLSGAGGGVVTVTEINKVGDDGAGQGWGVLIDDPRLNGNPQQRLLATHQFVGNYGYPLAVSYDTSRQKWMAFHEGHQALPVGERINYALGPEIGVATRADAGGPFAWGVFLDGPGLRFNEAAVVMATHNTVSTPGEALGVLLDPGTGRWTAYNETGGAIASTERYFYLDAGARGGRAVRTAANAYSSYGVYLDDNRINGDPNAIVLVQHAGQSSYNLSPVGVWYDGSRWLAYNENRAAFPDGEAIHYMIVQP